GQFLLGWGLWFRRGRRFLGPTAPGGQAEGQEQGGQGRAAAHCRSSWLSSRRIRAGTPPTTVTGGTSRCTTAPAATMAPLPLVTPGKTVALAPIHTLS